MADICRLCLSQNLVNNFIFDEDNKIYLKILSCLPVKVTRDDVLPKKICDVCSCKVDDFYQFCHKSIDSENRLHISKMETNSVEIKDSNIGSDSKIYQFSSSFLEFHRNGFAAINLNRNPSDLSARCFRNSSTQTGDTTLECNIKLEPIISNDSFFDNYEDDFSDQETNKIVDIKEEIVQPVKKVEKSTSSKGANKRKTQRKLKKDKNIKVKIKVKKAKGAIQPREEDSEEDISLIDILKKDKDSKLNDEANNCLIIDMKDIKTEIMDELALINNTQLPTDDGAGNVKEEWNCCICFLRCFDKEEMLAHYRLSHYSSKNAVSCEELISEVIQNEDGESVNVFVCPHCNIKSNSKTSHLRHIRSHGLDKPFKCSLCEKTFRNAPEILKHGKNAHKYGSELQESVGKTEGEDLVGPTRSTKRFMCDLCDETFVYMKYVQIHRNLCHPEARERQFVNRCLHCGREFAHLNSLRRHLRSHSGEKNYLCYICGKSLSSREHLKFHIRIHTGFKPHICKTCGKGFVKKCNLTLHERVHSGEKPHVCSHCGKAFSQRSTLVIHERYHSGARPYVCNICNKGFVAKGLLSMHLKTSCI